MSPTTEALCSLPVLALWLGPVAVVAFCGVFDGCSRIARAFARRVPPTA